MSHDRRVGLRRRRRHPGRPEGLRGRRLPRHERDRRADRAEHGRRDAPCTRCRLTFVRAQLEAVFDDIGVDAAKTGMLFSAPLIETVADFLERHPVPLVVDPVLVASSGARLLEEDAVETLVARLFPLATVVTPNLAEAEALVGTRLAARARRTAARARRAGGDRHRRARRAGRPPLRRPRHVEIRVARHDVAATHGAGCTHSATLAALLARGESLEEAARGAARLASRRGRAGPSRARRGRGPG